MFIVRIHTTFCLQDGDIHASGRVLRNLTILIQRIINRAHGALMKAVYRVVIRRENLKQAVRSD
jgi:hypothetical protein